jgi:hypothetical protein
MNYEQFEKLITNCEKLHNDFSELFSMGFDFLEGKYTLETYFDHIVDVALSSNYNEEGVDWVIWFMYESDFGKKDWGKLRSLSSDSFTGDEYGARDKDGNPICYDIKSLWEYIQQYKLK